MSNHRASKEFDKRPAMRAAANHLLEHFRPLPCDSVGSIGCVRCSAVAAARWLLQLTEERTTPEPGTAPVMWRAWDSCDGSSVSGPRWIYSTEPDTPNKYPSQNWQPLYTRPAAEPATARSPADYTQVHGALVRIVMEAEGCPPPCSHDFHKEAIASVLRIAKDTLKRVIPSPFGHDEAQARIAHCVREIEAISDSFGYDPTEWLAEHLDEADRAAQPPADVLRETIYASDWLLNNLRGRTIADENTPHKIVIEFPRSAIARGGEHG